MFGQGPRAGDTEGPDSGGRWGVLHSAGGWEPLGVCSRHTLDQAVISDAQSSLRQAG